MKVLEPGVHLLVAHRRLFELDHKRYFLGVVDGYEHGVARVTGHTWIHDGYKGGYRRKGDPRTKIISLSSGTVLVYQLPSALDLDDLQLEMRGTNLVLHDSDDFEMDLTEGVLKDGGQSADRYRRA